MLLHVFMNPHNNPQVRNRKHREAVTHGHKGRNWQGRFVKPLSLGRDGDFFFFYISSVILNINNTEDQGRLSCGSDF